jgi:isocitrate/isopropylmalate dehydrogenase
MMLDVLGERDAAALLERSVVKVLADGRDLTPDLGGSGTTETVTDRVVAQIMA